MPARRHPLHRRPLAGPRSLLWPGALALVALVSCGAEPAQPEKPAGGAAAVAARFVGALLSGDVLTLTETVGLPLAVREQQWQLSPPGEGMEPDFHLDPPSDRSVASPEELARFLPELVARSRSLDPDPLPDEEEEIAHEYLQGTGATWKGLEVFAFLREVGDLEHLLVLGVDPRAGRVRALYLN